MKNRKKIVVIMSMALLISMIFSTVSFATETKKGMYAVEGYKIKSITRSGNKIKVTTEKSKQMTLMKGEHVKRLKGKTFSFNLDKKADYSVQYYVSQNIKRGTWSKIKKLIKKSKKYKFNYKMEEEDIYSDFVAGDYPRLYIIVNKHGKVTDIIYAEGKLDILSY